MLTSFTRSAAAVLAGRVEVPRDNVATLHALAYRAIGSPPLAEEGELAKQWNTMHANRPAWHVGGPVSSEEDGLAPPDAETGEMMRMYSLARARLVPVSHPLYALTREFRVAWNDYKYETGSIDFTDMLENAAVYVPQLSQPVLIVDEAQDLVPLQWSLARQWGSRSERFLASGDPAQVLYSFAGARPDDFLTELASDHVRVLSQSYRLPEAVLRHAEGFLRGHSGPMMLGREYRPRDVRDHPDAIGAVRFSDATWRRPEEIVDMIERDQRDCMVLASCSYMLGPVVSALRERGIPFSNRYRLSNGAWNPLVRRAGTTSTAGMVAAYADRKSPADWLDLVRAEVFMVRNAKKYITDGGDTVEGMLKPEYMQAYEARDLDWLRDHMLTKYVQPASYAMDVIKKQGTAALDAVPRVTVGTIHSVKGGEARVVYLFPDISSAGERERQDNRQGEDAAIRLAYVGMTRASEELVLCSAADPRRGMW